MQQTQHSNSPKPTTPNMMRINSPTALLNGGGHSTPTKQFQALNTGKPLSPNNISLNSPSAKLGTVNNSLSSVPNLMTASIPNSLYGTMPALFGTPQLFAMSPSANTTNPNLNLNGQAGNTTPNRTSNPLLNSSIYTMPNMVTSPNSNRQTNTYGVNGLTATTPNGTAISGDQHQQSNIQQSGWGLAVNSSQASGGMIPTQPATNFMQLNFYSNSRTSQ